MGQDALAWKRAEEMDGLAWSAAWRGVRAYHPWWCEPEDLHQTALIAIAEAVGSGKCRSEDTLPGYAYACAWGAVRRSLTRGAPREEPTPEQETTYPREPVPPRSEAGVRRMTESLPRLQSLLLVGRYVYGYSATELAKMVGDTTRAVSWQMAEGLRALRTSAAP